MKKILILSLFFVLLLFLFPRSVNAKTFMANEIQAGEFLQAGDIIEFGTGIREKPLDTTHTNFIYNKVALKKDQMFYLDNYATAEQSMIVQWDCYVFSDYMAMQPWYILDTSTTRSKLHLGDHKKINSINIYDGETKRVYNDVEGGSAPYTYEWHLCPIGTRQMTEYATIIETENNYCDIPYGKYDYISCFIHCPDGNPDMDYFCGGTDAPINNLEKEEESDTISEPQIPSTLPPNTVQVSFGKNDKDLTDVKVLNQFQHDTINQTLLANLHAAKLKKSANIIMQKNIYAPYCANSAWRKASHTIIWRDLNVKQGDNIAIVWYTPTYFGLKPTLQIISATVISDGAITFTVPYMGDVSVMSIVKLI